MDILLKILSVEPLSYWGEIEFDNCYESKTPPYRYQYNLMSFMMSERLQFYCSKNVVAHLDAIFSEVDGVMHIPVAAVLTYKKVFGKLFRWPLLHITTIT